MLIDVDRAELLKIICFAFGFTYDNVSFFSFCWTSVNKMYIMFATAVRAQIQIKAKT